MNKMANKTIQIKKNNGSTLYYFFTANLTGIFWLMASIYGLFKNHYTFSFILLFLYFRLYVYKNIELLFSKSFEIHNDKKYINVFFLKLSIADTAFFVVEDISTFGKFKLQQPAIVLVRNNHRWYKRPFKNKIVLRYSSNEYPDLEDEMKLLSNETGINHFKYKGHLEE